MATAKPNASPRSARGVNYRSGELPAMKRGTRTREAGKEMLFSFLRKCASKPHPHAPQLLEKPELRSDKTIAEPGVGDKITKKPPTLVVGERPKWKISTYACAGSRKIRLAR